MADVDKKTTDLTELTTPAAGDVIHIVDTSDTTDDPSGSSKKIKIDKIIPAGGTTGQVLMKKSNSDFDTEFDDLVAVSVTTKGDIQTHDGSTPTALPVGTDGQILMADDAETNGIKWSDPPTSVSVTTKGDIQTHDATTPNRLPVGVDGQILSADSAEDTGLKWIDAPSGSSNSIINNEVPSGTIDGSNTSFTLANTPVAGSVSLYMNGVLQQVGASNDYTISGSTITFNTAPLTGSILLVNYLLTTGVSDNADTLDGQHAPTGTIVGTTDTQTLTNKTLTSPKINEDVALTSTATELNLLHSQTVLRRQVITGSALGVSQAANTTRYIGTFSIATDAYLSSIPFTIAGTIKNLLVYTDGAPGVGQTYTFTLMKNNADQAVTCTNSGNTTNNVSDTTHSFTVAVGDRVVLKSVTSATANAVATLNFQFEFDIS